MEVAVDVSGMVINESKTKFMAINGDDQDKLPINMGNSTIKHCLKYVYLGSMFTSDREYSIGSQGTHEGESERFLL